MHRTHNTFSVLQATAAVVAMATFMWSTGIPSFRIAEAANVTSFSNTLSNSAPTVAANHTITFVTPSGLAAGNFVSIDFGTTSFAGIGALLPVDVDLNVNGTEQALGATAVGPTWGVSAAGTVLTLISGTSVIPTNATVTIRIGTNASFGGSGVRQITNPTVGSYEINLNMDNSDTGATRVAIVNAVTVTASVDTIFNFTVTAENAGSNVNDDITTATSTPTAIPFGVLVPDTPAIAAQNLVVHTNAANGFVVTVRTDQQLRSSNGADIDGFVDGSQTATPVLWANPSATLGQENTYGHWGVTTNDNSLTPALSNPFGVGVTGRMYASASTTPLEIFRHNGPTNGTNQGIGQTRVGYAVEISSLQEAANDYTATLTYVATPIF